MNDLLTVKEFAEIIEVSTQAIYKQVINENSRLFPYVVQQKGKRYIKKEALKEVYQIEQPEKATETTNPTGKPNETNQDNQPFQPDQPTVETDTTNETNQSNPKDPFGKDIIEFLQEQLREKDKQIEKLQTLLDQEQHLHAQTRLLLEEKNKAPQNEEEQNDFVIQETKNQEPKKKKGFWAWLFGEE